LAKAKTRISTVDEYIATFPKQVGKLLAKIRATVKKSAPKAEEKVSWQMPAYLQNGMLLLYAAHQHHIGLYAMPGAIKAFEKELKGYEVSKGTIRFPLDRPLPLALIGRIAKFRVRENEMKAKTRNGDDQRKLLELRGNVEWKGDLTAMRSARGRS
jgi:uncharacterized protein YdhG (YjbR/CyaY superfamily)